MSCWQGQGAELGGSRGRGFGEQSWQGWGAGPAGERREVALGSRTGGVDGQGWWGARADVEQHWGAELVGVGEQGPMKMGSRMGGGGEGGLVGLGTG